VLLRDAARELGINLRRIYQIIEERGIELSAPVAHGRGRPARRLSRRQVEEIRAYRVAALEEKLRRAKEGG